MTDSESSKDDLSSVIVRKKVIVPSSDSDSEIESGEVKPKEIVVNRSVTINRYNGTKMKNPSILEKEKQMKFLLEIFPNLEAMVRKMVIYFIFVINFHLIIM